MSLYPWETAPTWAQWAATDRDGTGNWYSTKPYRHAAGFWVCEGTFRTLRVEKQVKTLPTAWDKSLEKRP